MLTKNRQSLRMWAAQGLFLLALIVLSSFVLALSVINLLEGNDEDEATFMMECVYDWGQTPDNCRKILQGQDPAPLPELEDGC